MIDYTKQKEDGSILVEKIQAVSTSVDGYTEDGKPNLKYHRVTMGVRVTDEDGTRDYSLNDVKEQYEALEGVIQQRDNLKAILDDIGDPVEITAEEAAQSGGQV